VFSSFECSSSLPPPEYGSYGLPQNPRVKAPICLFNIFNVIFYPFLKIAPTPPSPPHLPQARDPRANTQPRFSPYGAKLILGERAWTRPNHGHLAFQDIKKLGQLIDLRLPHETTDSGQPRVVFYEKLGPIDLILVHELSFDLLGISSHRPELEAPELTAPQALAQMRKEERPAVLEPNEKHDQWEKGQGTCQSKERKDNIKGSLSRPTHWFLLDAALYNGSLGLYFLPVNSSSCRPRSRIVPQRRGANNDRFFGEMPCRTDPSRSNELCSCLDSSGSVGPNTPRDFLHVQYGRVGPVPPGDDIENELHDLTIHRPVEHLTPDRDNAPVSGLDFLSQAKPAFSRALEALPNPGKFGIGRKGNAHFTRIALVVDPLKMQKPLFGVGPDFLAVTLFTGAIEPNVHYSRPDPIQLIQQRNDSKDHQGTGVDQQVQFCTTDTCQGATQPNYLNSPSGPEPFVNIRWL
jgi:hypothetical protein